MNIQETYKTIDLIIKSFKEARRKNDYLTIMNNGLALLEYLPALIEYSVDMESEYRKFESKILHEVDSAGKQRTSAYADTEAKATEYYKNWSYSKQFIELVYQLVAMAKKLSSSVDKEFNTM